MENDDKFSPKKLDKLESVLEDSLNINIDEEESSEVSTPTSTS